MRWHNVFLINLMQMTSVMTCHLKRIETAQKLKIQASVETEAGNSGERITYG